MSTARILVIDDEDLMREYVEESLTRLGHRVDSFSNGTDGVNALKAGGYDVVVTDLKMAPMDGLEVVRRAQADAPSAASIVMTAYGTVETAVQAMKDGAQDYILKPFAPDELELAVNRVLERSRMAEENRYLRNELNASYDLDAMIGDSKPMRTVHEQIQKVASSRATVLVRGESGVGKELVARAIHFLGERRDRPFIKINCAALSAGLLESELFGHEKGAFTGAFERKIGRFELADGGTLLLDEISEIGMELQPKLLRALQEREIDRVGGTHSIHVDTRIIATSNRNLEKEVAEGRFREDLFFRLNVIPIHLPPLRERTEDIPALMERFLQQFSKENGKTGLTFDPELRRHLMSYHWPGNVRELQNAIERAVVLSTGDTLTRADFPLAGHTASRISGVGDIRAGLTVAEMEKELIYKTLEMCGNNRTRAAKLLDISVRTLRNKLNEYEKEAEFSSDRKTLPAS